MVHICVTVNNDCHQTFGWVYCTRNFSAKVVKMTCNTCSCSFLVKKCNIYKCDACAIFNRNFDNTSPICFCKLWTSPTQRNKLVMFFSPLKGFPQYSAFFPRSCAKMQQALKSNQHAKFMHGHKTAAAPVELENR